jgi:hypothetical protein
VDYSKALAKIFAALTYSLADWQLSVPAHTCGITRSNNGPKLAASSVTLATSNALDRSL